MKSGIKLSLSLKVEGKGRKGWLCKYMGACGRESRCPQAVTVKYRLYETPLSLHEK
jgi:hypothetical protein